MFVHLAFLSLGLGREERRCESCLAGKPTRPTSAETGPWLTHPQMPVPGIPLPFLGEGSQDGSAVTEQTFQLGSLAPGDKGCCLVQSPPPLLLPTVRPRVKPPEPRREPCPLLSERLPLGFFACISQRKQVGQGFSLHSIYTLMLGQASGLP